MDLTVIDLQYYFNVHDLTVKSNYCKMVTQGFFQIHDNK